MLAQLDEMFSLKPLYERERMMKRIGMINTFNPVLCDGVSNSMFELYLFLKEQGHEVIVMIFFANDPYKRDIIGNKKCLASRRLAAFGSEIVQPACDLHHQVAKAFFCVSEHVFDYATSFYSRNDMLDYDPDP